MGLFDGTEEPSVASIFLIMFGRTVGSSKRVNHRFFLASWVQGWAVCASKMFVLLPPTRQHASWAWGEQPGIQNPCFASTVTAVCFLGPGRAFESL